MADLIDIVLPDGSTRQVAAGTTAGGLAEAIGPRLGRDAVIAVVDGDRARPRLGARRRQPGRDRRARLRPGSVHAAALDRARARAGRARPVPRRHLRHRAADRGRLLLRLRPARRPHVHSRRPRTHRRADARDHRRDQQPFIRDEIREADAAKRFAAHKYKLEIITGKADGPDLGHRRRSRAHLRQPAAASATCVAGRTCRTPAGSVTSSSCGSRAPTGEATSATRCCNASTAPRGSPRRR